MQLTWGPMEREFFADRDDEIIGEVFRRPHERRWRWKWWPTGDSGEVVARDDAVNIILALRGDIPRTERRTTC